MQRRRSKFNHIGDQVACAEKIVKFAQRRLHFRIVEYVWNARHDDCLSLLFQLFEGKVEALLAEEGHGATSFVRRENAGAEVVIPAKIKRRVTNPQGREISRARAIGKPMQKVDELAPGQFREQRNLKVLNRIYSSCFDQAVDTH